MPLRTATLTLRAVARIATPAYRRKNAKMPPGSGCKRVWGRPFQAFRRAGCEACREASRRLEGYARCNSKQARNLNWIQFVSVGFHDAGSLDTSRSQWHCMQECCRCLRKKKGSFHSIPFRRSLDQFVNWIRAWGFGFEYKVVAGTTRCSICHMCPVAHHTMWNTQASLWHTACRKFDWSETQRINTMHLEATSQHVKEE